MIGTGEEEIVNLDNLADGMSELKPTKKRTEPVKMKAGVVVFLVVAVLILLVAAFYALVIRSDIEVFDGIRQFIIESNAYQWIINNLNK